MSENIIKFDLDQILKACSEYNKQFITETEDGITFEHEGKIVYIKTIKAYDYPLEIK